MPINSGARPIIDIHSANVFAHVSAGASALAIGVFALLSRKGGWLHRRSGKLTAGLGGVALATAVLAVLLFDPPAPLVAATLSASYQYMSGLRTLALGKKGPGWPDAALACVGLLLIALLVGIMGQGTRSWTPAIGYSTMGFIGMVAVYDLSRHFWIETWRTYFRPLDHGVKMIGFYFAMMSAGFGNLLEQWQPLSQVLPSTIGLVAMLGCILYYSTGGRQLHAGSHQGLRR